MNTHIPVGKVVGVIGTGALGRDPFHRRTWSFSSYYLFTALQKRGALHRAFGVEASRPSKLAYQLRNFRLDRRLWRDEFYLDTGYYGSVTAATRTAIVPSDFDHAFLQIGAFYDVPAIVAGRAPCFSYHDGNLAELIRSPYTRTDLSARKIDRAMEWERRVYAGLDGICVMSDHLRTSFIEDFSVAPEKVVTVGGGINLDVIPPAQPDKLYRTREILFVGADFTRKGGFELLRAFKVVRDRYDDAVLHVVGPDKLVIPAELGRGVTVHGFLDKSDPVARAALEALFRRCVLFVMPSLYEPFGIAPLEAMTYQLACVLTDRWALREFVEPGRTGELVGCGSADDLADKLLGLLREPERLQPMGVAARAFALENFTWDKVTERLLAAWDKWRAA